MFVRITEHKNKDGSVRRYLYIVESYRDKEGRPRQRVMCLGKIEELEKKGKIEELIERLIEVSKKKTWVDIEKGLFVEWSKIWGPVYVFRKLWEESGLKEILKKIRKDYEITFDLEEGIFQMVLNRIVFPESKRGMFLRWKGNYFWGKEDTLSLHHYYRSLSILAREMERIEEELYLRGRDLFSEEPYLTLFDTTRVYFEGNGVEDLAEYGYSRKNPDKKQIIVGIVMREEGIPIMQKVFKGNQVDKESFREVIKEIKERFGIKRTILVADRGCVDRKLIKEIEEEGMEYIVGIRMRKMKEGREAVGRGGKFSKGEDNLLVKEVKIGGRRYIVVKNEEEAERERRIREEVLISLREKIKGARNTLIGNRVYRKFLKIEKGAIKINEKKIKEEERFDGKWVILTNTNIEKSKVARYYKELWRVERAFRELKDVLQIRPIWHWSKERVLGHVGICFLALYLESYLGLKIRKGKSLRETIREMDRLSVVKLRREKGGNYLMRTEIPSSLCETFRELKIGFPPRILTCNDTPPC